MTDIHKKGLRLNAVTGPNIPAPAVNPDTLRELVDPYYGFLQTYELQSSSSSWHGRLKNIGLQYSTPNSILLPPSVTEQLQLNNDDIITLKPSQLSEARTLHYSRFTGDQELINKLPALHQGMEIGEYTRCTLNGIAIELNRWEPEGCYLGPGTQLIETEGIPRLEFTPENRVAEVYIEPDDQPINLTQENPNEDHHTNHDN